MTAYVAIDYGAKRAGVAVSDPEGRVALPYAVLDATDRKRLIDRLEAIAAERDAEFVVGVAVRRDGSERRQSRRARAFASTLERATGRRVHLYDETLTTFEAEERARLSGRPPGEPVDDLAAQAILESFLCSRSTLR